MSQEAVYPPSQEFKISSSTDRALARRKITGVPSDYRKVAEGRNSQSGSRQGKTSYKRASERPPAAVARRNARERRRVHTVNQAFNRLKTYVPTLKQKTKRVSKLKILKAAIDYVYDLQDILADYDAGIDPGRETYSDAAKNFDEHISGQMSTRVEANLEVPREIQSAYEYTDAVAEVQITEMPRAPAHGSVIAAEEHQITRRQNQTHQYQPGQSQLAVVGRGMITVPRIPSTAIPIGEAANCYGVGQVEMMLCHYCGQPTTNLGYGNNGLCDRCSGTFANYSYAGASGSIAL